MKNKNYKIYDKPRYEEIKCGTNYDINFKVKDNKKLMLYTLQPGMKFESCGMIFIVKELEEDKSKIIVERVE